MAWQPQRTVTQETDEEFKVYVTVHEKTRHMGFFKKIAMHY